MDQFWIFLKAGILHVLNWSAYNHLLFLTIIAVAYSYTHQWKRLLWLITIFTIGHTLAYVLAFYGVVSVSAAWVEFLVPVIIFIAAIYTIFTAGKKTRNETINLLFFISLFYGIVHGLGFRGDFDHQILPVLEFSLGIEIGQIIVAIIILLLSFLFEFIFRFSKRDWTLITSSIVIGLLIPVLIENWLW